MDGNLWSIPIEITRIEKVNCEKGRYYTVQPRGTVCNTIEYE
jgi:hypothetical protein